MDLQDLLNKAMASALMDYLPSNMTRGQRCGILRGGKLSPRFHSVDADWRETVRHLHRATRSFERKPLQEKVLFHKRIKDVEPRLKDPTVILNSFILSLTRYPQLKWDNTLGELEEMHVLFMTNDRDRNIGKLFVRLRGMVK